jgi:phosphatidylserine/phosphatidylglycerophosphate/cardiolipin synthase-like enzyme
MGWHDVASRLRGPAVADIARHIAQRWQAVTGERLEARPAGVVSAGDVELQIARTVPEKLYEFAPHGEFRITRRTCARCAPPGTWSTWSTSSCGRRRS